MLPILNLPTYQHRLGEDGGHPTIFDPIRKRWVRLLPEEWVRQNLVCFLQVELGYPRSLFRIEAGLRYDRRKKRSDVELYDSTGQLLMLVECKAPKVRITEATFQQAAAYCRTLSPRLILISNGLEHFCCRLNDNGLEFLADIPSYEIASQGSGK